MTDPSSRKRPSADQLKKALAVLISSTRTRARPISLTRVAQWLNVAISALGSDREVAERLGLTPKMLRQFLSVSKLSKPVQLLFDRRQIDSVDAAAHLSLLAAPEQYVVAQALAKGQIDTSDLRAVIQLKHARPKADIGRLIDDVKRSKTQQRFVAEFVVRGARSKSALLREFQKYVSKENIIRLDIDGPIGRLVLSKGGQKELFAAAKLLDVRIRDVIGAILRR